MKYRKKPVVIEAMQFTGTFKNFDDICQWIGVDLSSNSDPKGEVAEIFIDTLEGEMRASINDWIIKGVKSEFYPCKPDIFEQTYEPVE